MKNIFKIIGYSGHAFVILDSASRSKLDCLGYYDVQEKLFNLFNLPYSGSEEQITSEEILFISIGDNNIRKKIYNKLKTHDSISFLNIIDPSSSISPSAFIKGFSSIYVGVNAIINSLAKIETGTIINTAVIIEHEVRIGKFCHIAPNATICGNATIHDNVFIGANSVVKQGIEIGENSIIGAGSVVLKNVPPNSIFVGNPAKKIS